MVMCILFPNLICYKKIEILQIQDGGRLSSCKLKNRDMHIADSC